jgi:hypothetical protein
MHGLSSGLAHRWRPSGRGVCRLQADNRKNEWRVPIVRQRRTIGPLAARPVRRDNRFTPQADLSGPSCEVAVEPIADIGARLSLGANGCPSQARPIEQVLALSVKYRKSRSFYNRPHRSKSSLIKRAKSARETPAISQDILAKAAPPHRHQRAHRRGRRALIFRQACRQAGATDANGGPDHSPLEPAQLGRRAAGLCARRRNRLDEQSCDPSRFQGPLP